ncbi:MAG: cysteine peptidase family C39 domain-containing protein [Bacillota bacterium]|nr:cysteine peptidase family C39 domain-containing protein [Bacillota bacterium]
MQMEASECGAACLAMMLAYYGQEVSLERLRIETHVNRDGCKASNIVKAAASRGFQCGGYRKTAEGLFELDPPCIIFWENNHFVVFEGQKRGNIYINDPAFGERKLTQEEFEDSFSGIAITLSPPAGSPDGHRRRLLDSSQRALLSLFADMVKSGPMPLLVSLLLSMLVAGACAAASFNTGRGAVAAACMGALVLLILIRNHIISSSQYRYTEISGSDFLEKLLALPAAFFEQRYPGDIADRAAAEERVSRFVSGSGVYILSDSVIAVILFICQMARDSRCGAIGILLIAAGYAAAIGITRELAFAHRRKRLLRSQMTGKMFAAMSNTEMIKITSSEERYGREEIKLQKEIEGIEKNSDFRDLLAKILIIAGELLAIVFAWGGETSGERIGSMILLFFFAVAVNAAALRMGSCRDVLPDVARTRDVKEYIAQEPENESTADSGGLHDYEKLRGNIVFDNVSFGYHDDHNLIEDFSWKISAGSCVGITGETGSGKSTLLKLAAGLYEPDQGGIYFDKKRRSEIPDKVMHTSIAFAMQRPQLFPGSIRDNISMWNPQIKEESIIRAAKDACIHDVIMDREAGYDSEVKENGSNFSGGQKQRIEIARALAADPTIVLLDEVTSGLDQATAEQIVRNIQRRGCTCLIVSYQKSIIDSCDEIITIEKR